MSIDEEILGFRVPRGAVSPILTAYLPLLFQVFVPSSVDIVLWKTGS